MADIANWIISEVTDITEPAQTRQIYTASNAYTGDERAHTWRVRVMNDKDEIDLDGYTVQATFIRPDSASVYVNGVIDNNEAVVTLPAECYIVEGNLRGILRIKKGDYIITIREIIMRVEIGRTDKMAGTGDIITISEVINIVNALKNMEATAETLVPESPATAEFIYEGTRFILKLGIPHGGQGIQGIQGIPGRDGIDGEDGADFQLLGLFETLAVLQTYRPVGLPGEAFAVGTATSNNVYIWDIRQSAWVNVGPVSGAQGIEGKQGPIGPIGPIGPQGLQGEGTITGGTEGQVMVKQSAIDYDAEWETLKTGRIAGLSTINEQTASIVQIDNLLPDMPLSVTARTVSAQTTMNVWRGGRNIVNHAVHNYLSGGTRVLIDKGVRVTTTTTGNVSITYHLPLALLGQTITVKAQMSIVSGDAVGQRLVLLWGTGTNSQVSAIVSPSFTDGKAQVTVTLPNTMPAGAEWLGLRLYPNYGTATAGAVVDFTEIQLEIGSVATDYEAYAGATFAVTLPVAGQTASLSIPSLSGLNTVYTDSGGETTVAVPGQLPYLDERTTALEAKTKDLTDAPSSLPFIVGTQTASTSVFTGNAPTIPELTDGMQIMYYLPFAGTTTGATLSLTLKDGSSTGPIPCYYRGSTVMTTNIPQYGICNLIYRTSQGTVESPGWWLQTTYYVDTYDRVYYSNAILAAAAIYRYKWLCQDLAGNWYPFFPDNKTSTTAAGSWTVSTTEFRIGSPILYYNTTTTVAAGSTLSNLYTTIPADIRYNINVASLTNYAPVLLKGKIGTNGGFIVDSTNYYATAFPTTDDGYYYMFIGYMYSTTSMRMHTDHPVYYYKNGVLNLFGDKSTQTLAAAAFPAEKITISSTDIEDGITPLTTGSLYFVY